MNIIAFSFFISCSGDKKGSEDVASKELLIESYPVFTVKYLSTDLFRDYPVTIDGQEIINIQPKIDGYINKVYIDEGSLVSKGQVLFTIFNPQYEQELDNAQAAVISAKADVNSAEMAVRKVMPLVEKDIVSKFELESAEYTLQMRKAALKQAGFNVATAKTNLSYTKVISPINGVVGRLPLKTGSYVSSTGTTPLTTISNTGKIFAYFSMNEKQLLEFLRTTKGVTIKEKLKNSPPVILLLSDGTQYSQKGNLEAVLGQINSQTGSSSFRATFSNPEQLIRSGASGTIRIADHLDNAILLPQKSTYEMQGKRFVYIVKNDNTVKTTEVEVMDITSGDYFVVKKGLNAGDKVVLDGSGKLQNDVRIKPEMLNVYSTQ
ncbi:efflux RND transporter periplasmic adaptor subunit [Flavobacterium branchiarum]|uniref:Efflux RND transporter periplasmic adaptor subunit n=1 Tax=Flavobacterium branchiarum TaxID=1114870 RepID=A0ABV5FRD6_9FLAO|nr:efflux RND transporter periplasmic adaptor subunit [Flavobacterium branchiarum]MDN3672815.1 efflux RND transporter periplasmic adaptor subunit [Flavobacterium branchiarum]